MSVRMVVSELTSISERSLASWFAEKYIRPCCCQHVRIGMNLHNTVSAIINCRITKQLRHLWTATRCAQNAINLTVSEFEFSLSARSCICWKRELTKIGVGSCLTVYFSAVAILQLKRKMSANGCSDKLADILSTVFGHKVDVRGCYNRQSTLLFTRHAAKLMKDVANKSRSTVQLIEIELSKAYLHRALRCKDSDSDSIYCLSNVYLTVLYYTTRQYQTAIDHCTLVMRSQDHSQCSSHVVQGELLPKIDDDIDNVLGLTVFYQYVLSAALNQQQTQYVSVFTTELFACYMQIKCLPFTVYALATQIPSYDMFQRYVKCISHMQQFLSCDLLAFKSLKCSLKSTIFTNELSLRKYAPLAINESKANTFDLFALLQKAAVEHLTTYRQLQMREFSSEATIVTTDFEAMYAYKHGDYQRCLQLSIQRMHTRCCMLFTTCAKFRPIQFLFSYSMMILSRSLD